jgi:hypothetical protein
LVGKSAPGVAMGTCVLSGHEPATTNGQEAAGNPFLDR